MESSLFLNFRKSSSSSSLSSSTSISPIALPLPLPYLHSSLEFGQEKLCDSSNSALEREKFRYLYGFERNSSSYKKYGSTFKTWISVARVPGENIHQIFTSN
ncbi:hypothetical protein RCL_jg17140.t1 [Rhizophagus clarus]|uniref:Uncharacterized protein n=1 Tax=Rhizophagus clarus TaxID=94130 RepID=A0A8H3LMI5_9GLOM|nr:hypothetical protein RCL_jg17140.t1 [Rhizophagus clarus]